MQVQNPPSRQYFFICLNNFTLLKCEATKQIESKTVYCRITLKKKKKKTVPDH